MGVQVKVDAPGYAGVYIFANHQKRRRAKFCGTGKAAMRDAKALTDRWRSLITLGRADDVFAGDKAEAAPAASAWPALRKAVEEWLERQRASGAIRGSTATSYLNRLSKWAWPRVGDVPVDRVTREMLGEMFLAIKVAKRSPSLVGQVAFPLRGYYRELVETKQLAASPMSDVLYFTRQKGWQKKRVDAFSLEETGRLLAAARATEPGIAAFVATGLLAGLRWGEIAALQPGDVSYEAGVVQVRRNWSDKAKALHEPKTARGRRAVKAGAVLLEMLKAQAETASMEAQAGRNPRGLLFPTPEGPHQHWKPWLFATAWERLLRTTKVPARGFHATRHSYISQMLLGAADPAFVARQVGDTLQTIIENYAHCIDHDRHDAAVSRLDELVGG